MDYNFSQLRIPDKSCFLICREKASSTFLYAELQARYHFHFVFSITQQWRKSKTSKKLEAATLTIIRKCIKILSWKHVFEACGYIFLQNLLVLTIYLPGKKVNYFSNLGMSQVIIIDSYTWWNFIQTYNLKIRRCLYFDFVFCNNRRNKWRN